MQITKIQPNWMHGYGNRPEINVYVDQVHPHDSFIYDIVPSRSAQKAANRARIKKLVQAGYEVMLISTNNTPWTKFVYIENPSGDPQYYGALGGEYKLTSGNTFKTRTGWSSRASVINRDHPDYLPNEITEVTVYETSKVSGWGGFNLDVQYLQHHELWPKGCYLVREVDSDGEIKHTISVEPDKVVKANP